LNENELIRGCQNLDGTAQHKLFQVYAGKLLTICRRYAGDRHEAEDMLQEAFINIFKNINQYKSLGSFEGWIRRITVNAAIQVLQKRKIRFTEIKNVPFEPESRDNSVLLDLEAEDLLKVISLLPDGYRTVFNLFVLEGYSHEEIAQMMKIETATSRSQLSKARAMLREKINSLQKIRVNNDR
jgi:RNA polymerase sigma factor (sigma-70 family)